MSKTDPRFYNPNNEPITLTDEIEFEEMIRKVYAPKKEVEDV